MERIARWCLTTTPNCGTTLYQHASMSSDGVAFMLVTEHPATLYCMRVDLIERALTGSVIGAFYEVYNALGYGFLERLYSMALERELRGRGHSVARDLRVNVMYKGEILGTQRLDMVVENRLIIEIKSTYELHRSASRQVYN